MWSLVCHQPGQYSAFPRIFEATGGAAVQYEGCHSAVSSFKERTAVGPVQLIQCPQLALDLATSFSSWTQLIGHLSLSRNVATQADVAVERRSSPGEAQPTRRH
jgi:hypothetical protein